MAPRLRASLSVTLLVSTCSAVTPTSPVATTLPPILAVVAAWSRLSATATLAPEAPVLATDAPALVLVVVDASTTTLPARTWVFSPRLAVVVLSAIEPAKMMLTGLFFPMIPAVAVVEFSVAAWI